MKTLRAVLTSCLLLAAAPTTPSSADEFNFAPLNRTYRDLVSDFAPIRQGGVTLTLSSPNQTMTVKRNLARLTRRADGTHDGRLEIDVDGKGWLIGDVDWGGTGTRLQDELQLPAQTIAIDGRVAIERSTGGYSLKALDLPPSVKVKIQSKLASSLMSWCGTASLLSLGGLDCSVLERSLTEVVVPLPAGGESYFLSDSDIGPQAKALLDAYLARK
jgi:hypothetical protein